MSATSNEGRAYHVASTAIAGTRYVQVAVTNRDGELVTRDHFTVEEGRTFAAEFIIAAEC